MQLISSKDLYYSYSILNNACGWPHQIVLHLPTLLPKPAIPMASRPSHNSQETWDVMKSSYKLPESSWGLFIHSTDIYWTQDTGHTASWTKHTIPRPPAGFVLVGIWMKSDAASFLGQTGTCRGLNRIPHQLQKKPSKIADPNSSTYPHFLEFRDSGMDQRFGALS